jgi:hypothetical protein
LQRCLHRQACADNDFIYTAVAGNIMTIATHRHGCCVLQRCIDFASDEQAVSHRSIGRL